MPGFKCNLNYLSNIGNGLMRNIQFNLNYIRGKNNRNLTLNFLSNYFFITLANVFAVISRLKKQNNANSRPGIGWSGQLRYVTLA